MSKISKVKRCFFIAVYFLIFCFSKAQIITTIAGNGTYGYAGDGGQAINAELRHPTRITVDNSGNIYVSDWARSEERRVGKECRL